MFDWVFAFIHMILLLGLLGYSFYSLFIGKTGRSLLLLVCLGLYYIFILHGPVKKEIARRKKGSHPE